MPKTRASCNRRSPDRLDAAADRTWHAACCACAHTLLEHSLQQPEELTLTSLTLTNLCRATALLFVLALTSTAAAQPAAVEQHTEKAADAAPAEEETSWTAGLGGSLNTGNTESWMLNAGTDLRLVRDPNVFSLHAAFAMGQADIKDDTDNELKDTVKNFNAKVRYDYFLTEMDALFVATGFRWDTFAGLDSRVSGQLGYLRNFFKEDAHRFWGEIGYDLTLDNYDPDPLLDDAGNTLDGDAVVHSARGFLGYDNQINDALTYLTGLEALVNVEDAEDTRVNWDNALRSAIDGNFQLETKFTLGYDNVPVPGARKLDTATLITLLYTLK